MGIFDLNPHHILLTLNNSRIASCTVAPSRKTSQQICIAACQPALKGFTITYVLAETTKSSQAHFSQACCSCFRRAGGSEVDTWASGLADAGSPVERVLRIGWQTCRPETKSQCANIVTTRGHYETYTSICEHTPTSSDPSNLIHRYTGIGIIVQLLLSSLEACQKMIRVTNCLPNRNVRHSINQALEQSRRRPRRT